MDRILRIKSSGSGFDKMHFQDFSKASDSRRQNGFFPAHPVYPVKLIFPVYFFLPDCINDLMRNRRAFNLMNPSASFWL
jgi:hypothetical protein